MMQHIMWIDSIELLEILANPIRVEIIDLLRFKAYSPMRLSKYMNVSPQKLNYHFKLLHQNGLIYKKYEEKKRGAYESFYQPIAHVYLVDQAIFNDNEPLLSNYSFIESVKREISEELNLFPKAYSVEGRSFKDKNELIKYINTLDNISEYKILHISKK